MADRRFHPLPDELLDRIIERMEAKEPLKDMSLELGYSWLRLKKAVIRRVGEARYKELIHAIRSNHTTWNKGLKGFGVAWLGKHQFTKDQPLRYMAARKWVPVGTVHVWKRTMYSKPNSPNPGKRAIFMRYIKFTDDPRLRAVRRWMPYARWLWEQENGPIPKGHCVVHLDRDLLNDSMDNLFLMSHSDWLQYLDHRFPKHREKRIKAISVARRRRGQGRQPVRKKVVLIRECAACSADLPEDVMRCPKCGSESFVVIERTERLIA